MGQAIDAMHEAREKFGTQQIGEFLDWLEQTGIVLAKYHEHTEGCRDEDGRLRGCGLHDGDLFQHFEAHEKLLARYAGVDLEAVEREKRAILQSVRSRGGAA